MSTATLYLTCDCTTLANFNSSMSAISAQFDAMGWTKTSDTGQVNWSTNTTLPATKVWTLYEIRQPASDPLNTGTSRYVVRIEYGQWSSGGGGNCLRVAIGLGTDGAGNLSGSVLGPQVTGGFNNTVSGTGTITWECDFSWGPSYIAVMLWRNNNVGIVNFFAIERTKDISGNDTVEGVTLVTNASSANPSTFQQTFKFSVGPAPSFGTWAGIQPTMGTGNNGSTNLNNSVAITPLFPLFGYWGNPQIVVAGAYLNDMQEGSCILASMYGSTRKYLMTKTMTFSRVFAAWVGVLMRWD